MKHAFKFASVLAMPLLVGTLVGCGNKASCTLSFDGEGYTTTGVEEKYNPNSEVNLTISADIGYSLPEKNYVYVTTGLGESVADFTYELNSENTSATLKFTITKNTTVSITANTIWHDTSIDDLKDFIDGRQFVYEEKVPTSIEVSVTTIDWNVSDEEVKAIVHDKYGITDMQREDDVVPGVYYYVGSKTVTTDVKAYINTTLPNKLGLNSVYPITSDDVDDALEASTKELKYSNSGKTLIRFYSDQAVGDYNLFYYRVTQKDGHTNGATFADGLEENGLLKYFLNVNVVFTY